MSLADRFFLSFFSSPIKYQKFARLLPASYHFISTLTSSVYRNYFYLSAPEEVCFREYHLSNCHPSELKWGKMKIVLRLRRNFTIFVHFSVASRLHNLNSLLATLKSRNQKKL